MPVSKQRKKAAAKTKNERLRREAAARQKREKLNKMADTLKFLHDAEQELQFQKWLDEEGVVDPRPCKGKNSNICVAEGCDGDAACIEKIEEITE